MSLKNGLAKYLRRLGNIGAPKKKGKFQKWRASAKDLNASIQNACQDQKQSA